MQRSRLDTLSVVCVAFLVLALSQGFSVSIGVFYLPFIESFRHSAGVTSWIGSLHYGVMCAVGPLAGMCCSKFGVSVCLVTGGILMALGVFATSFATNIFLVFGLLGIVAGVGCGFLFITAMIMVTTFYTRWRSVAVGFAMSGIGVGHFILPFVMHWLEDKYSWRGACLVLSALQLHPIMGGFIMRIVAADTSNANKNGNYHKGKASKEGIRTLKSDIHVEETYDATKVNQLVHEMLKADVENDCRDVCLRKVAETNPLLNPQKGQSPECMPTTIDGNSIVKDDQVASTVGIEETIAARPDWLFYSCVYISTVLFCFSLSIVLTHTVAFAVTVLQYDSTQATSILSTMGIASVFGRLLLGIIVNLPQVSSVVMYVICNSSSALLAFMFTQTSIYGLSVLTMVLLGVTISSYGPVLNEMVIYASGVEKYSVAYGWLMSGMALGTFLGAPTAGWLYDYSANYCYSFYLASVAFLLDAVIIAGGFCVHRVILQRSPGKQACPG